MHYLSANDVSVLEDVKESIESLNIYNTKGTNMQKQSNQKQIWWAVEINGDIGNLYDSRSDARLIRNAVAQQGIAASVRKVELKVVKGRWWLQFNWKTKKKQHFRRVSIPNFWRSRNYKGLWGTFTRIIAQQLQLQSTPKQKVLCTLLSLMKVITVDESEYPNTKVSRSAASKR